MLVVVRKSVSTVIEDVLGLLPLPAILVKHSGDDLNHPIVALNPAFERHLGWQLADIPDKNHWWQAAYPEQEYQKVVARQWELSVELADKQKDSHISMTVNIETKHSGSQRFKVVASAQDVVAGEHYVVMFVPG